MLLIECPWCGPRAESEFSCGGEADIVRPVNNENMTDREWGEYVFMRENKRGLHKEQWLHAGLPPLVQGHPRHGDLRYQGLRKFGGEAAGNAHEEGTSK